MKTMNKILAPLLDVSVICFMDDILVYSKSKEEHITHLQQVLSILRKEKFYAKLSKCSFGLEEIEFLGYRISKNGIECSKNKIKAIQDMPSPKNKKELRSFIGMASFYRKFIKKFSEILTPLTELTKERT